MAERARSKLEPLEVKNKELKVKTIEFEADVKLANERCDLLKIDSMELQSVLVENKKLSKKNSRLSESLRKLRIRLQKKQLTNK